MRVNKLVLLALLSLIELSYQFIVYDESLASCQAFAQMFDNTCDPQATPTTLGSTISEKKTCNFVSENFPQANLYRKLCATCSSENDQVIIRIQSNGLPNHCVYWGDDTGVSANIDFKVNWNKKMSINSTNYSPATQTDLDTLICKANWPSVLPEYSQFTNMISSQPADLDEFVGIALNGVLLSSGFSTLNMNVDPIFPIEYDQVTNINDAKEMGDTCLTSVHNGNNYHHYHIISPCILDSDLQAKSQQVACFMDSGCSDNLIQYSKAQKLKTLMPIGIAKDGHPIYGPYNSQGKLWQPCDVDICNGVFLGDQYAYVATMFHPYFIGCWGPGNKPMLSQSCSANPRKCSNSKLGISHSYIIMVLTVGFTLINLLIN
ncbi:UNKNOWN [Stylonychia lemnae]|uniref:YHYH domain-containing protein n=1 Tax=Stylonychia lemnae TaxID=5949 RepID=A0A078B955_STYLE|nr:UNKNOWN [Stylonychia lemnae]|eukprot:CDW91050.1 UNKNOWN [Stylonychia lemnae]